MLRRTSATFVALSVAVTGFAMSVTTAKAASSGALLAPEAIAARTSGPKDTYIVVMRSDVPTARANSAMTTLMREATNRGGVINATYHDALTGFSATLTDSTARQLRADPEVSVVQKSQRHTLRYGMPTGNAEGQPGDGSASAGSAVPQGPAPWQLDRIDQRWLPLDGVFAPGNVADGRGVDVYVVDSGIRSSHAEFGHRVEGVFTSINDGRGTEDCAGHGTFVASQIGGATFGVAKAANLKAVRMMDCNNKFTDTQALAAFDWMAKNVSPPAIVNMSLESDQGDSNPALDAAVARLIDKGLILTLITGNFDRGDCQNSPKDPRAITVAASTMTDTRNTGTFPSSYGPCTTVFAPGADVTGAGIGSDTAVETHQYGTSFAAPLVAGVLAARMQLQPTMTMFQAKNYIVSRATPGVLKDIGSGSPNLLLYLGR